VILKHEDEISTASGSDRVVIALSIEVAEGPEPGRIHHPTRAARMGTPVPLSVLTSQSA